MVAHANYHHILFSFLNYFTSITFIRFYYKCICGHSDSGVRHLPSHMGLYGWLLDSIYSHNVIRHFNAGEPTPSSLGRTSSCTPDLGKCGLTSQQGLSTSYA